MLVHNYTSTKLYDSIVRIREVSYEDDSSLAPLIFLGNSSTYQGARGE